MNQEIDGRHMGTPYVRVVKRRSTANKKERRRTQSINNAYADLRDCIPNVPADTKLSKIKTLRLATSYILYLIGVLETDDPAGGFRAELGTISRKSSSSSSSSATAQVTTSECASSHAQQKTGISVCIRLLMLCRPTRLLPSMFHPLNYLIERVCHNSNCSETRLH